MNPRGGATPPTRIGAIRESLGSLETVQVFVHGATRALIAENARNLPWMHRYGERALLLARPGDVVCLERAPDSAHLADLRRLGLGPPRARIVVTAPREREGEPIVEALLRDQRALRRVADLCRGAGRLSLNPFRASAWDLRVAAALRRVGGCAVDVPCARPAVVERADSKAWVRAWAGSLGVPLAEGEVARVPLARGSGGEDGDPGRPSGRKVTSSSGSDARDRLAALRRAIAARRNKTARVIVRGAFGAAGSATFLFGRDTRRDAARWREIAARQDNDTYLVEVFHDVDVSPNVLLHVPPDRARVAVVGVTDQRLDARLAFQGTIYPSRARTSPAMQDLAVRLAASLQAHGYGGYVGFDFCERRGPRGRREPFLAEVNPRVNAALYPLAVFERLQAGAPEGGRAPAAFVSGTVETAARSYGEVRDHLAEAFYDPARGTGALPYAVGMLGWGRLPVVAFGGTRAEAARRFADVAERLAARGA